MSRSQWSRKSQRQPIQLQTLASILIRSFRRGSSRRRTRGLAFPRVQFHPLPRRLRNRPRSQRLKAIHQRPRLQPRLLPSDPIPKRTRRNLLAQCLAPVARFRHHQDPLARSQASQFHRHLDVRVDRVPRQRPARVPTEVVGMAGDHHAVAAVAQLDLAEDRGRSPVPALHQQAAAVVAPAEAVQGDQQADDHRSERVVVVVTARNCSR